MIQTTTASGLPASAGNRVLPHSTDVPFDRDCFLARCLGNHSFADRMLAKFRGLFRSEVAELQRAGEAGDGDAVARIAHRLKGSAANLSAPRLRDALLAIEQLGREQALDELPASLDWLNAEWQLFEQHAAADAPSPATRPLATGVFFGPHAS